MKGKCFQIPPSQNGLPCKSFVHIIELDLHLKRFLSLVNEAPYFNQFVTNCLTRLYRYNDRKKLCENYHNFMATNTVDRIDFIFYEKLLSREKAISLVNSLHEASQRYLKIKENIREGKDVSEKDLIFYHLFIRRWIPSNIREDLYFKQIRQTRFFINRFIDQMIDCFQSYIIKYLLINRKGDKDPLHLRTDAYEIIMTLINSYNYRKSKIPFHNIMRPYISNHKNKLIKWETWGLDNLVYLDTIESYESSNEEDKVIQVDKIWSDIEKSLYFEQKQDDKERLVEMAYASLPRPFKEIVSILYEIVDPLSIKQETKMALASQD